MKKDKYNIINFTEAGADYWLVGNIVVDGNKFIGATIVRPVIDSIKEINNIRSFLNEVEKLINKSDEINESVAIKPQPL